MSKTRLLFFLGILMVFLPYLGFPRSYKDILFSLSGCLVIYLSLIIKKENKKTKHHKETIIETFKENNFIDTENQEQI